MKMTLAEAVSSGQLADFCRRWEISEVAVFGSMARGDGNEQSDIDLLVRFAPFINPDYSHEETMRIELQNLFGRKVDLVRENLITNPLRRHNILLDKRLLFPTAEIFQHRIRDGQSFDRDLGLIWDIVQAGRTLRELIVEKRLDDYRHVEFLRLACERLLITIGQAARALSPEFRDRYPDVPWAQIVGHRNRLVHSYGNIDQETVWKIITTDVPRLVEILEPLMPSGT